MSIPHIPVLRQGRDYESLERSEIKSVRTGEPVAQQPRVRLADPEWRPKRTEMADQSLFRGVADARARTFD